MSRTETTAASHHETSRGLLRSGSAATLANLVRTLALLATHLVVRRFVPPDEWAVWNWLEAVFLVLATVRDAGFPSHAVRLRPIPFGNLLRAEIGLGVAIAAALLVGAPLVARAMADPHPALADALRVLTVAFVIEGCGAVALAWFEAHLRIERTLGAEMLRTGAYCAIVLAAAARGAGFWSFVIAQSVGQILFAAALWWRARGGLRLHFVPGATGRMVVESIPLGSIWLLGGAVTYADPFIVGRLFSREQLGLYAAAYFLAFFVFRILQLPFGRSLYPAFLAFRDRPDEQFRAFRLGTVAFLALEVPAALVLALNAELVVSLVFGPTYAGAAPYLRLLAFAPLADPLGRFGGELLIARHRDRARVLSLVLHLTALVVGGIALSLALGSPFGMAWANFLPLGAPVIVAVLLAEVGRRPLLGLVGQLVEVYLVPVVPFAAAWWLAGDRPWLRLVLSCVAALATLGWTWLRHRRDLVDFFSRRPAVGVVEGPVAT